MCCVTSLFLDNFLFPAQNIPSVSFSMKNTSYENQNSSFLYPMKHILIVRARWRKPSRALLVKSVAPHILRVTSSWDDDSLVTFGVNMKPLLSFRICLKFSNFSVWLVALFTSGKYSIYSSTQKLLQLLFIFILAYFKVWLCFNLFQLFFYSST